MLKYISMTLLIILAVLFVHSELGGMETENTTQHIQHDYCHLVDSTLPTHSVQIENKCVTQGIPIQIIAVKLDFSQVATTTDLLSFTQNKHLLNNSKLSLFSSLLI